jgi:transposase
MKPPLFVRPLTTAERAALQRGLRAQEAFTLRRCQVLLHSAQGQRPAQIATALGCGTQTVRDALHAFAHEGLDCLRPKPTTPHAPHAAWTRDHDEDLRALLHQSPRVLGKPTSLWTLELAAAVCHEKGWTPHRLSRETLRRVLKRLGVGWKRAKHWLVSPDPAYARKKNYATN